MALRDSGWLRLILEQEQEGEQEVKDEKCGWGWRRWMRLETHGWHRSLPSITPDPGHPVNTRPHLCYPPPHAGIRSYPAIPYHSIPPLTHVKVQVQSDWCIQGVLYLQVASAGFFRGQHLSETWYRTQARGWTVPVLEVPVFTGVTHVGNSLFKTGSGPVSKQDWSRFKQGEVPFDYRSSPVSNREYFSLKRKYSRLKQEVLLFGNGSSNISNRE